MKEVFNKFFIAFKRATNGQETVPHMIWWWGFVGYLLAYFVFNKLVLLIDLRLMDILISLLMVFYFSWHFYALKKCAPKKPKLTDEEKKRLKEERKINIGKSAARKLFLQEPITKWDPIFMSMTVDVLCVTHFASYIFK